jgi:hypothetical protein
MTQDQIHQPPATADPYRMIVAAMFAQARRDARSSSDAVASDARAFLASDDALAWAELARLDVDAEALAA